MASPGPLKRVEDDIVIAYPYSGDCLYLMRLDGPDRPFRIERGGSTVEHTHGDEYLNPTCSLIGLGRAFRIVVDSRFQIERGGMPAC